jgi:choline kinase
VLAVEKKIPNEEDMKVQVVDGRVIQINKEMPRAKAYGEFTGLAKINANIAPKVVNEVKERIERRNCHNDFFEVVIQDLIDSNVTVKCYDIGERLSIEIDFPEDYELAQSLYNNLDAINK